MNIRIDEGYHDKRSWEPWSQDEIKIFFDSIVKHGRNWALIAKEICTKRREQVIIIRNVISFLTTPFK